MATRIEWSWDDRDGHVLQRFSRVLCYEAWLIGSEYGDGIRHANDGRFLVDTVTGDRRERALYAVPFPVSPRRVGEGGKLAMRYANVPVTTAMTLDQMLQALLPKDGSFPRRDALDFLRSLAPEHDESYVALEPKVRLVADGAPTETITRPL